MEKHQTMESCADQQVRVLLGKSTVLHTKNVLEVQKMTRERIGWQRIKNETYANQVTNIAKCLLWDESHIFALNLWALLKVLNYLFLVVCLGGWKQTGGCDPDGVRESQFDKTCGTTIASGWSGYCDCEKGRVKKTCASWSYKNCNEACI